MPPADGLEERQQRLAEEYGFECRCARCVVEANMEAEETGEEAEDMREEAAGV